MIAYIEDNIIDFEAFKRRIPDVERFILLKDFLSSENKYELVVVDLSLPGAYMNEVLDEFKDKTNVVILTGLFSADFDEAKKNLKNKGFKHVLSKSFLQNNPKEFTEYIHKLRPR